MRTCLQITYYIICRDLVKFTKRNKTQLSSHTGPLNIPVRQPPPLPQPPRTRKEPPAARAILTPSFLPRHQKSSFSKLKVVSFFFFSPKRTEHSHANDKRGRKGPISIPCAVGFNFPKQRVGSNPPTISMCSKWDVGPAWLPSW